MPPRFQKLRDQAVGAVDRHLGEPVKLLPLKDGREDGGRAKVEFTAVLRTEDEAVRGIEGGQSKEWKTQIAGASATLFINRSAYQGPSIVTGDKVVALDRPGEPIFEVLHVDDRNHARLIVHLGAAR